MSDAELAQKVHGLVDPILGSAAANALLDRCEEVPQAEDVRTLVAAAQPAKSA